MRAKHCMFGCTLLLAMNIAGSVNANSAAAPAPAGHVPVTQWQAIPEDSVTWHREPFKTPEASKQITAGLSSAHNVIATSPELALQGILKSNKHFHAIINGRTVKSGDHIEGWTIADISRYRVIVRRDKEKHIFDIYQGRINRGTQ